MGLGFVNAKAHWSYSGFNIFREKLANEIGICLPLMEGYWILGDAHYSKMEKSKNCIGQKIMDENFYWMPKEPLKLDNVNDPIKYLLVHSDCDGHISYTQCKKIAPRLRDLIKDWHDEDYDKQQAILLAEGMENCYKEKKKIIFC